jgi:hypothetical protein
VPLGAPSPITPPVRSSPLDRLTGTFRESFLWTTIPHPDPKSCQSENSTIGNPRHSHRYPVRWGIAAAPFHTYRRNLSSHPDPSSVLHVTGAASPPFQIDKPAHRRPPPLPQPLPYSFHFDTESNFGDAAASDLLTSDKTILPSDYSHTSVFPPPPPPPCQCEIDKSHLARLDLHQQQTHHDLHNEPQSTLSSTCLTAIQPGQLFSSTSIVAGLLLTSPLQFSQ